MGEFSFAGFLRREDVGSGDSWTVVLVGVCGLRAVDCRADDLEPPQDDGSLPQEAVMDSLSSSPVWMIDYCYC